MLPRYVTVLLAALLVAPLLLVACGSETSDTVLLVRLTAGKEVSADVDLLYAEVGDEQHQLVTQGSSPIFPDDQGPDDRHTTVPILFPPRPATLTPSVLLQVAATVPAQDLSDSGTRIVGACRVTPVVKPGQVQGPVLCQLRPAFEAAKRGAVAIPEAAFVDVAGGRQLASTGTDDRFISVWQSCGASGCSLGARAYFGGDLNRDLVFFDLSPGVDDSDDMPATAMSSGGDAIVVWRCTPTGASARLCARRIDGSDHSLGAVVTIAPSVDMAEVSNPDVAALPQGVGWLVVWAQQTPGSAGNSQVAYAQLAADAELAVKRTGIVHSGSIDQMQVLEPAVAIRLSGGFMVAWLERTTAAGENVEVYGRTYESIQEGAASSGRNPLKSDRSDAVRPKVRAVDLAASPLGYYVAVWDETDSSPDQFGGADVYDSGIRLRTIGSSSTIEMVVNQETEGDQTEPSVAVREDGGIFVVWTSEPTKGQAQLRSRLIPGGNAAAARDEGPFRVALQLATGSATTGLVPIGEQRASAVALDAQTFGVAVLQNSATKPGEFQFVGRFYDANDPVP